MATQKDVVLIKGTSERGVHARKAWTVTWTAEHAAHNLDVDTFEIGAVSVAFRIRNDLNVTLAVTLQVSHDKVTWTNIPHKDLAAAVTVAGSFNILTTATKDLIVSYSAYPEALSQPYFRLVLDPASAPAAATSTITIDYTGK